MEPNTLLAALLDEAGISRAGLAARINQACRQSHKVTRYDHTSVGRWIKGQRPRSPVPDHVCEILGEYLGRPIGLQDIGMGQVSGDRVTPLPDFVARAASLWRHDQQGVAAPDARFITGMQAVAPVWEWENPPEDHDVSWQGGPGVQPHHINVLRAGRGRYETMYRHAGGVATRGRVVNFLNEYAAPLFRGSYSGDTGRDLFHATGGLVAVAGICAYDSGTQGLAQRYFHQALRLAKASGDRSFGGYVIALLVNQSLFLECHRQAIAFAEAGLRSAGAHISPALRTDLYVMQAKAFAGMKAVSEAHRCITLAEQTAGRIRHQEEPPETRYVQPGLVEAQLAEALIGLGELRPARAFAVEAVRTNALAHARGRVHRMATLATVDLDLGEAERAAASATTMVELAVGMESHHLQHRFEILRDRLMRTGNAAARDAAALIDQVLAIPL